MKRVTKKEDVNRTAGTTERALQLFEPAPGAVYTIETTSHLAQLPRRTIVICYKHGLVSPAVDPADIGYRFDDAAIRHLRRIQNLRAICGDDLPGIKMILNLMDEVTRLHSEMRSLRDWNGRSTLKGMDRNVAKRNGGTSVKAKERSITEKKSNSKKERKK
jgi:DNA-binding transcriptional MerR regulator